MFCYNCGSKVIDGAKFCASCGTNLSTSSAPVSAKTATGKLQLRCDSCNGTLIGTVNNPILKCPFCGSTEMIIESDAVKTQRIKSDEHVTIQRDKSSHARQMANDARDFEREKRNTLSIKGKITLAFAILSVIACIVLAIIASVADDGFWYGYMIFGIAFAWMYYGIAQMGNNNKN